MKKMITLASMLAVIMTGCAKIDDAPANNKDVSTFLHMAKINDTTYEVTANVQPTYATNKHLTWSVAWAPDDASTTDDNAFKTGKTATDYVGIEVSTDTLVATLTLAQAFASQIVVSAAVTDNPAVKGSLKVDYEKRLNKTATSNYKLVPATDVNFVHPVTYSDSIGTVPHNKVVTYEYSNKFYWYGGSQTQPVEDTNVITATRGEGTYKQDRNLLVSIGDKLASRTTRTFDFKSQTLIFTAEHAGSYALDDLAYYATIDARSEVYRNKGAKLAFGYKTLINGVQDSTGNAPSEWAMVPIDFTGYNVAPTSVTISDTTIIF